MKKKCYLTKPNTLENIITKNVSEHELAQIKNDFLQHLEQPWGTLENYPKKELIKKIIEYYPGVLEPELVEEYTQYKVNTFMGNIYNFVQDNVRINNNPIIIKMLLNFINGKEDSNNFGFQQQIVINTRPLIEKEGQYSVPEPKINILND